MTTKESLDIQGPNNIEKQHNIKQYNIEKWKTIKAVGTSANDLDAWGLMG